MSFRVVKPGVQSSVQDLGRPGHGAVGVPAGGAADRVSLTIANRLVGNPDDAAGIEMTLVGMTVVFERGATIALAGAAVAGGNMNAAVRVAAGETVPLGALSGGARCYLAVAGGVDVPLVLGSRGTLTASGLGGFEGRPLRTGDVIKFGEQHRAPGRIVDARALASLRTHSQPRRLRAVPGPHLGVLGQPALDALLAGEFVVSDRSDRVGVRLTGAALNTGATSSGEMITEPMFCGAIQVPPDGQPILLGPDAPVTGGYPVLASVISADLHRLGQLAPRERARFELVSIADAAREYRELLARVDAAIPSASIA